MLVAAAIRISSTRDLGASALASHDRSKPRTLLLGDQAGLTIRLTWPVIAAWLLALSVTGLVFGLVAQAAGAAIRGAQGLEEAIQRHYGAHPLGHRVLGTSETIAALPRDAMQAYFDQRYSADNTLVAMAGWVDFDARVRQIDRPAGQNAALAIVSNYADGQRLSDLMRQAQTSGVAIELIARGQEAGELRPWPPAAGS